MGGELPSHRQVVAGELGESGADVRVFGGDQAGGLHDEHDRIFEHDAAQSVAEPGTVAER